MHFLWKTCVQICLFEYEMVLFSLYGSVQISHVSTSHLVDSNTKQESTLADDVHIMLESPDADGSH